MHERALIELDVEAFLHATEKHVVAYQLITFNNISQLIASAKLRAGGL